MNKQEAIEKLEQAGFTLASEDKNYDRFVKEYKPNKKHYYSQSQVVKVELDLNYDEDEDGSVFVESIDWSLDIKDTTSLDDTEVGYLVDLLTDAQSECQELESDIV